MLPVLVDVNCIVKGATPLVEEAVKAAVGADGEGEGPGPVMLLGLLLSEHPTSHADMEPASASKPTTRTRRRRAMTSLPRQSRPGDLADTVSARFIRSSGPVPHSIYQRAANSNFGYPEATK